MDAVVCTIFKLLPVGFQSKPMWNEIRVLEEKDLQRDGKLLLFGVEIRNALQHGPLGESSLKLEAF